MKRKRSIATLTHERIQTLVVLCVGMAILLAVAIGLTTHSHEIIIPPELSAATAHGTVSNINPAPGSCTTDGTASGLCGNSTSRAAIFSVHMTDTVTSSAGSCRSFFGWRRSCSRPTTTMTGMTVTEQCRTNGRSCTPGRIAGSALTVPQGANLTLEVDWLRRQRIGWPNGCDLFCGDKHDWSTFNFLSSCTTNFGLVTTPYTSYHSQGSITLTATESKTYTVSCNSANGNPAFTLSIPVTVLDSVGRPTLTITGNGTNPTTVGVGQPVLINAIFAPSNGDTLVNATINDSANNAVPGVSSAPGAAKTYTFTPSVPGTYTFYPAARSVAFPAWDNHNASLVVTVTGGLCGPNEVGTPPNCTCTTGFSRDSGGVCSASCSGPHQLGTAPNCSCEVGYTMQGGSCVVATCSGANEVPPTCTCDAGYTRENGVCTRPPVLSILVNGAQSVRVNRTSPVLVTWSTSGVQVGSCSVRNALSGTVLYVGENSPTPAPSESVAGETTYQLSCLSEGGTAVSAQATVSIIPVIVEPTF